MFKRLALLTILSLLTLECALRAAGHFYLTRNFLDSTSRGVVQGDTVVLCIGESTTGGLWVRPEESYPMQLEKLLQQQYPERLIRVIAPLHIGQNTSHMLKRLPRYLEMFNPSLLVLMVGANNEWAYRESNIMQFLPLSEWSSVRMMLLVELSRFRVMRLLNYLFVRFFAEAEEIAQREEAELRSALTDTPAMAAFPPPQWVMNLARDNQAAFHELWHADLTGMLALANQANIPVALMTYPIQPAYLPAEFIASFAARHSLPLARVDEMFAEALQREGSTSLLMQDNWHPNPRGYAIVAEGALELIRANNLLGTTP